MKEHDNKAAGQAGLAKLTRYYMGPWDMKADASGQYVKFADVQALLAAPVAADTEQAIQVTDTESARRFVDEWHKKNFPTDRTFTNYIMGRDKHCALAGDFAWQLATPADAPTQQETDEHSVIALLPEIHAKLIEAFKEGACHGAAGGGLDCDASAAAVRIMHAWDLPDATPADAGAEAEQPSLSNDEIDAIWQSMPGGPSHWLKGFGYQQFAKAVEAEVLLNVERARLSTPSAPVTAEPAHADDIAWGHDLQLRLMSASQDVTEHDDARQVMAEAACCLAALTGRPVSQSMERAAGAKGGQQ